MSGAGVNRILAEISANGGRLLPQPDQADSLVRFTVEYAPGADRCRCRAAVAELKADPTALHAALEIVRQSGKAAFA